MGDILSAIAQYGLGPVIASAIIYLLITLGNRHAEKKNRAREEADKMALLEFERRKEVEQQQIQQEKERQFMDMVRQIIAQTVNPPHTVEEQRESRRNNQFISHQLDCLVEEGADRAYVFSFHNGGKDLLGHGFLKMSMTQESIGENIMPIMAEYQAMPRMLFPKLYEELERNDCYNIDNVDDLKKTDLHTYQFLLQHGVKSAMFRPIKDEFGLMIGFIGMEYINNACEDKKKAGKNIDKKTNRIMGAMLGQPNN